MYRRARLEEYLAHTRLIDHPKSAFSASPSKALWISYNTLPLRAIVAREQHDATRSGCLLKSLMFPKVCLVSEISLLDIQCTDEQFALKYPSPDIFQ